LDLVEPQGGWATLGKSSSYGQDYVYGNVLITSPYPSGWNNYIHWDADQYNAGARRAEAAEHRLFLYQNTFAVAADRSDVNQLNLVNSNYGGWDCPPTTAMGHVDLRNNIIAFQPKTTGSSAPTMELGYCKQNFDLSQNWISPGWTHAQAATVTGAETTTSPTDNNIGFNDLSSGDVSLVSTSSALGLGGALAPQVTANAAGQDYTPVHQYHLPHSLPTPAWNDRTQSGAGADLGAFEH